MATLAEPPAPCTILPPPLYLKDPFLYSQLIHFIMRAYGLTEADRLVLLGVLKHMPVVQPSETQSLVTRVMSLDRGHLKLLADLFTSSLLDARGWGGLRRVASSTSTAASTSTSVSGQPTPAQPLVSTGYNDLFHLLSIASPFPTGPSVDATTPGDRAKRSVRLSRDCLKRQNGSCPLTTRIGNSLETAHIIPHSVASMSRQDTAFWLLLAITLGPALRDHLYSLIYDTKSYSTTNGLALDASMHRYFDAGTFVLLPAFDTPFDPASTDQLDVTFNWRSSSENLETCFTRLPPDPASQVSKNPQGKFNPTFAPQARRIDDGDVFRLFTDDAQRLPLPHPFLLSLHALLWRMIGSSGLAETTGNKRKRLALSNPRRNPTTHGGDNGDDNDDGDDGDDEDNSKGKRVKRGLGGRKGASGSGSTRKGGKGDGGSGKDTSRDDGPAPAPSGSGNQQHTGPVTTNPGSPPPTNTMSSASHQGTQAADEMPFLEKEYLAFQLRRLAATTAYNSDSNTDDTDDTDDDTDDEPNDWVNTKYGSPRTSQTPTFLEAEFARFHQQRRGATARELSISGSDSEGSDYDYDSDSG